MTAPDRLAEMHEGDLLAHALGAALDQAERDRPAKRRAEIARRHEADRAALAADGLDAVRAGRQRHSVRDRQPDQLLAVRSRRVFGEQRALADEFRLPLVARPGDAEVVRHAGAVGVLAGDDVAFLGAQQQQRLGSHQRRHSTCRAISFIACHSAGACDDAHGNLVAAIAGES